MNKWDDDSDEWGVEFVGKHWYEMLTRLPRRHNDVYYDGLAFARQIGLLPAADSAGDRAMMSAFNAGTRARHAVRNRVGR